MPDGVAVVCRTDRADCQGVVGVREVGIDDKIVESAEDSDIRDEIGNRVCHCPFVRTDERRLERRDRSDELRIIRGVAVEVDGPWAVAECDLESEAGTGRSWFQPDATTVRSTRDGLGNRRSDLGSASVVYDGRGCHSAVPNRSIVDAAITFAAVKISSIGTNSSATWA